MKGGRKESGKGNSCSVHSKYEVEGSLIGTSKSSDLSPLSSSVTQIVAKRGERGRSTWREPLYTTNGSFLPTPSLSPFSFTSYPPSSPPFPLKFKNFTTVIHNQFYTEKRKNRKKGKRRANWWNDANNSAWLMLFLLPKTHTIWNKLQISTPSNKYTISDSL